MTSNKELETGLKVMAEDFYLPGGGRMKLSRLVAEHLGWFDAATRRGMGWPDMIRALTAAGVTGKSGRPLSVGTLSSTVWRKRAETEDVMGGAARRARLAPPEPAPPHPRSPKEAKRLSAGQPLRSMRATSQPIDDQGRASRSAPMPSKGRVSEVRAQNKDVLAFMDRARAVRRRSE